MQLNRDEPDCRLSLDTVPAQNDSAVWGTDAMTCSHPAWRLDQPATLYSVIIAQRRCSFRPYRSSFWLICARVPSWSHRLGRCFPFRFFALVILIHLFPSSFYFQLCRERDCFFRWRPFAICITNEFACEYAFISST